jgi:hypothetical protein
MNLNERDDIFKTEYEEKPISDNSLEEELKISDLEVLAPDFLQIRDRQKSIELIDDNGNKIIYTGYIHNLCFIRSYKKNNNTLSILSKVSLKKNTTIKTERKLKKFFSKKDTTTINTTTNNWHYRHDNSKHHRTTILFGDATNLHELHAGNYKEKLRLRLKNNDVFVKQKLLDLVFDPIEEGLKNIYQQQAKIEQEFLKEIQ